MSDNQNHLNVLKASVNHWLRPDNTELKLAIERTVDEQLFSFEDIKYQLKFLKEALSPKNIDQWISKSDFKVNSLRNKTILCLHAGNLPVVGIQDLLAVMLSGANYFGKLSNKDPYLLPTLINILRENGDLQNVYYSTELKTFFGSKVNAWMFSGAENNAYIVKNILADHQIISAETPSLLRTAFFSAAYIDRFDKQTMKDLTEAVFRYGGSGCRSVALIVSPFEFDDVKCELTDYIEQFWLNNPQHRHPSKSLTHRFALNKAVGKSQAWLHDFLIEEGKEVPREKFILRWKKGDFTSFSEIVKDNNSGLQSVYSTAEHIGKYAGNHIVEPLSSSQKPPIWWKPDGINSLEWLQKNLL